MTGTKATALDAFCRRAGRAFTRFDYSGHGASGGRFADGTIGQWLGDALAVFDQVTRGPQVVVGSSMGGWIAALLTLARPDRVAGLVTLAAAPDFTSRLIEARLTDADRAALARDGFIVDLSDYDPDGYEITRGLIEEGRGHLILGRGAVAIRCPLRMIHGDRDTDVPWALSAELLGAVESADATLTLVKGADHRLSSPADIARMEAAIAELAG
ncbi:lysophospholipase [Zavarzinia compransoris]|uniref:alpha/beta hydrolase n=1 Tax=Zavarzinia marina TaxID=2911065 RepID=UPI001F2AE4D2|nr:alpha/beta fold hydrolase [Zavarzinia marina]MCF4167732.1 lysophospholipase [Zavarzinia marina]